MAHSSDIASQIGGVAVSKAVRTGIAGNIRAML